jgi:subtilisin family serine protease
MFSLILSLQLLSYLPIALSYILVPKYNSVRLYQNVLGDFNLNILASFHFSDTESLYIYENNNVNLIDNDYLQNLFYIEDNSVFNIQDQFVFSNSEPINDIPWHLSRITKRKLPLDNKYPINSCLNNENIDTYVIDTGIDITHPEFQNRAKWGSNFVDNTDTDCNSHGTHVAGLIGSKTFGVCKDANLFAVKVLDCEGRGSLSGVIKGIEWAFKQHQSKQNTNGKSLKSIINMSLGGGYSFALNQIVEKCIDNDPNFFIVVAAGNENSDACRSSPAGAKNVLSVMASDQYDNRAWFSNYGNCTSLYSPGVDVTSTIPNGKIGTFSGTSMASPILAGAVNYILANNPDLNMKTLHNYLLKTSSKNVIKSNKNFTPNNLVYIFS